MDGNTRLEGLGHLPEIATKARLNYLSGSVEIVSTDTESINEGIDDINSFCVRNFITGIQHSTDQVLRIEILDLSLIALLLIIQYGVFIGFSKKLKLIHFLDWLLTSSIHIWQSSVGNLPLSNSSSVSTVNFSQLEPIEIYQ